MQQKMLATIVIVLEIKELINSRLFGLSCGNTIQIN